MDEKGGRRVEDENGLVGVVWCSVDETETRCARKRCTETCYVQKWCTLMGCCVRKRCTERAETVCGESEDQSTLWWLEMACAVWVAATWIDVLVPAYARG
eukprot:1245671-Rhodomonas_salina.3